MTSLEIVFFPLLEFVIVFLFGACVQVILVLLDNGPKAQSMMLTIHVLPGEAIKCFF